MCTRKNLIGVCMAGLALAGASVASHASVISADSWVGFCFDGVGSAAYSGCQNMAPQTSGNAFTFTLVSSGEIKVTDAFLYGDSFDVYDFGTPLFMTNSVGSSGGGSSNPDLAWADPLFSHGSAILGAGSHSITIFAAASPHGTGAAYMGVFTAPVPVPAAAWLFGSGLLGLVGMARSRR